MADIKTKWQELTRRNAREASDEESREHYGWHHFKEHFFDTGNPRYLSGFEIFAILIICSIIGYCIEMVFGRITNGYWESRQSLVYGPFGLAYGLGGTLLTLLLFRDTETPLWRVFLKSFVWLTFAEYIMSLGMELVFGHVAWDYSQMPLNIGGRVCLLYSLFWGFLGCLWAKLIYPGFNKLLDKIHLKPKKILFWIIFVFFVYDCITSAEAAARFNERQENIPPQNAIDRLMDKQFPDEYMRWVYANSMDVDEEGNVDTAHTLGQNEERYTQK
ncbi:MAG: putative ABC transporter permease, partial [Eubacteriales bacterium]|nr:putative ABC transporter permease [Eubacteriales bacterium]